jgi:hypothetical protein
MERKKAKLFEARIGNKIRQTSLDSKLLNLTGFGFKVPETTEEKFQQAINR